MQSSNIWKSVGFSLGAAVLVPLIVSTLTPLMRPLARWVVKGGILVYEIGREKVEQVGESLEDLVAEVQEELLEEREAQGLLEAHEPDEASAAVEEAAVEEPAPEKQTS